MFMEKDTNSKHGRQEEKLSICDIMKEGTSEIIKKMESKMPATFQSYSDMYSKYLHTLDDIFGTCYIAEKEFFDKLNIDQDILRQIKQNSESVRKNYVDNIDRAAKLFDENIKIGMESIESFDSYAHMSMESYAKMLSQFNQSTKSSD
jgi:predicted transcriptional regulator